MLSVEQALEKVLAEVNVLDTETAPILDTLGQVLAEEIVSGINVPPLDNSAMDGFAVIAADTTGASDKAPKVLKVIETVMAGAMAEKTVMTGTAIRIMTGAPIPAGANAVVQFENTQEGVNKISISDQVSVLSEAKVGLNIRRAGEDVAKGALALKKGTLIRPAEIGLLASIGRARIKVIRRPVVAVLSTGNELSELGAPLPPGKIYDSNLYSIAALVKRYGCVPQIIGIALDEEKDLVAKLKLSQDADILLTTGGVSMGDYDLVKDILERDGQMVFWQVRVKPGKPLAFGKIKGKNKTIPHLGLPGNAVSCMVSFELFVRPALLKMMGKNNYAKPTVEVIMQETVKNDAGRRLYNRAVITRKNGSYYASLTGPQGSGILKSMHLANGLVLVPEEKTLIKQGETLRALMLDWNEEVNL